MSNLIDYFPDKMFLYGKNFIEKEKPIKLKAIRGTLPRYLDYKKYEYEPILLNTISFFISGIMIVSNIETIESTSCAYFENNYIKLDCGSLSDDQKIFDLNLFRFSIASLYKKHGFTEQRKWQYLIKILALQNNIIVKNKIAIQSIFRNIIYNDI